MSSPFCWPVRVYHEDTDLGGVVYHANYLRFMERARSEWLRSIGLEQDRALDELGLIFVVVSTDVRYLRPARYNDTLQVTVMITDSGPASLTFRQEIRRDEELLCEATVRAASVRAASFRPSRLPARVSEALGA